MPIKMVLTHEKDTKRTYVFKNEEALITSVYVSKAAFPNGCPKAITLELSEWFANSEEAMARGNNTKTP